MPVPFEVVALEWLLEKHLRVCLESPQAMEERLIHDGWPEALVLYARALMAEMSGKAGRGEGWRPGRAELKTPACVLLAEINERNKGLDAEDPEAAQP